MPVTCAPRAASGGPPAQLPRQFNVGGLAPIIHEMTVAGPSVLILFPGDIPSGPSFVINYGRFVVNITSGGQFIVQRQTGTQFDVCAALS